jgi:hypothetical protein
MTAPAPEYAVFLRAVDGGWQDVADGVAGPVVAGFLDAVGVVPGTFCDVWARGVSGK